jgi:hypothetical protein
MSFPGVITDWYHHKIIPSLTEIKHIHSERGTLAAVSQATNWTFIWVSCQLIYLYSLLETTYQSYAGTPPPVETLLVKISHDSGATVWNKGTTQVSEELAVLRVHKDFDMITNIKIHFTQGDRRGVRFLAKADEELAVVSVEDLVFTDSIRRKALCVVRKRDTVEYDITTIVNQYLMVPGNKKFQIDGIEDTDGSPLFQPNDQIILIDSEAKQHEITLTDTEHSYLIINDGDQLQFSPLVEAEADGSDKETTF